MSFILTLMVIIYVGLTLSEAFFSTMQTAKNIYEKVHGKLQLGWNVHHLDWNKKNNNIENLIGVPITLHDIINAGKLYLTRKQIQDILLACSGYFNSISRDKKEKDTMNYKYQKYLKENDIKSSDLSFKQYLIKIKS